METEVVSDLHYAAPSAGLMSEFSDALQEVRQRLFDEHMSSGPNSPEGLRNMKNRWSTDECGVGLISIESDVEILKHLDSELSDRCETLGVGIAGRQPWDTELAQVCYVAPPD